MHDIDYFPVISSLVAAELGRIRNCSSLTLEAAGIHPLTEIGNGDLNTDSLDLLKLASTVSRMFHLHEIHVSDYLLRCPKLGAWAELIAVSLREKVDRLTFQTSGSNGKAKHCVHRIADLQEEIDLHAASFRECQRILTLVPRHHIYGFLFGVMLPQHLGVEVLNVRRWAPSMLAAELRAGDLLIGVPSIWRYLSDNIGQFSPSVAGVTSGAPCPAPLFHKLQAQALALTEIYGASETGGIGSRRSPHTPFELLSFWTRTTSGNSLKRLCSKQEEPREVEIPDELDWLGPTRFTVRGRRDGAVQVSGINVFPEHVAATLRQHASVKDCTVRLMRLEEGTRFKAFVVWRDGEPTSEKIEELRAWLSGRLPPHERPESLTFGLQLPCNDMGKLTDWNVPDVTCQLHLPSHEPVS